jgi:hypothetical protein
MADLDRAAELADAALSATPEGHPKRTGMLGTLGVVLSQRFEQTGALADVDAAIAADQAAIAAMPPSHPRLGRVQANLGVALTARFRRTAARPDLDGAVALLRDAATVDAPSERNGRLGSLCIALHSMFRLTGDPEVLDEGIDTLRSVLDATPPGHPHWAMYSNTVGVLLRERHELTTSLADLDAAAAAARDAVDRTGAADPAYGGYLSNLGNVLITRHALTGDDEILDELAEVSGRAVTAQSTSPSQRISAAWAAASAIAPVWPHKAQQLLEAGVRLLPLAAPRHLDRYDQQHTLSRFAGLSADAVALTIGDTRISPAERATRALMLYEIGRGVILGQALGIRGDLTELKTRAPGLAAEFAELRQRWDAVATSEAPGPERHRRHSGWRRLSEHMDAILTRIRAIDGMSTFGSHPSPEELIAVAERGPVIALNVSRYRSDALVLTREGVTSVPLPNAGQDAVLAQVGALHDALRNGGPAAQPAILDCLEWLWDAVAEPVVQVFDHHGLPRVWWIAGGLLGLLPVASAGRYRGEDTRSLLDCVVPSHTPTLRALRHARRPATPRTDHALIIAMTTTPGASPLPQAAGEAATLQDCVADTTVLTSSGTPTRQDVIAALPHCTIAHFACHGVVDVDDPSRTRLLLADHETHPLTVADLATIQFADARMAYLSACGTAANRNFALLDEAIHLTSAFTVTGFRTVVGTLWEINDRQAAQMAAAFYRAISRPDGSLDTEQSARALHRSVQALRDARPSQPFLWAGYLHSGA